MISNILGAFKIFGVVKNFFSVLGVKQLAVVGVLALTVGLASGAWLGSKVQKGVDADTLNSLTEEYNKATVALTALRTDYEKLQLAYKSNLGTATAENANKASSSTSKRQSVIDKATPPTTSCPDFALSQETINTINQLLEISNETGFYSAAVLSDYRMLHFTEQAYGGSSPDRPPYVREGALLTLAEVRSVEEVHGDGTSPLSESSNLHP